MRKFESLENAKRCRYRYRKRVKEELGIKNRCYFLSELENALTKEFVKFLKSHKDNLKDFELIVAEDKVTIKKKKGVE